MPDITPPKETTNYKNFRPTTRFLRAKGEKGGGVGVYSLTQKKKEEKNDVNIARAVLTQKKNRFKKQIKRELFNGPCPTSDTKCCNQCL